MEIINKLEDYNVLGKFKNIFYIFKLKRNKYYTSKNKIKPFIKDKDFVNFFDILEKVMKNNYMWDYIWIKDNSLWIIFWREKVLKKFIFILDNYELDEYIDYNSFENNYHNTKIWSKKAILSSAIYYLIESNLSFKKNYDSNKYYNICLDYLDKNFKKDIKDSIDEGFFKKQSIKYNLKEEDLALSALYDMTFWSDVFLTYNEWNATNFATGNYLKCLK